MINHTTFMKRCITLAQRGSGQVKTNPMVGSVVVYNGEIISEGWHERYGGYHAERNALLKVPKTKEQYLSESTLYVTLEPCNHHGKTPPCTDIILEKGIKKVIVGQLDPNPLMMGKSIAYLIEKGVDVQVGILEEQVKLLNRKFITNQKVKTPYVILKYAQSKDGYIGQKERQIWLSNQLSKKIVHKWRSEIDTIMVGTNTAITDNPQLNTRLHPGSSPIRVLIDRHEKLPKSHHLISDGLPTIIYTTIGAYQKENDVTTLVKLPSDESAQLLWILRDLYTRGISTIMVEGGGHLLNSFITQQLWHEARIISVDKSLNKGIKAPVITGIKEKIYELDDDIITILRSHQLNEMLFG